MYSHGVSYFSVPKCACTSLKMMFFELENGFAFREFSINGNWLHIHKFYISKQFEESRKVTRGNTFKFTVIRSPQARILSCFQHWVASENGRKSFLHIGDKIKARNAPVTPNWEEFVDHLETYRGLLPGIEHHSQPLSYFLGTDPDYFTKIYNLKQLPDMVQDLDKISGKKVNLQHYNVSEAPIEIPVTSEETKKKIKALSKVAIIFGFVPILFSYDA